MSLRRITSGSLDISFTVLCHKPIVVKPIPFGCMIKSDRCPYAAGENEAGKDANEAKDCMRLNEGSHQEHKMDGKQVRPRTRYCICAQLRMIFASRGDSVKRVSGL